MNRHHVFGIFLALALPLACTDDAPGDTETGESSDTAGTETSDSSDEVGETAETTDETDTDEAVCGDGDVGGAEECDDGNDDDGDDCTNACLFNVCGDGLLNTGVEECDDGNLNATDACTSACLNAVCGDGFMQVGVEGCDDGNLEGGDGCSAECTMETCGDGELQDGEACDDGNEVDTDDCTNLCQAAACGDGVVWADNEVCDDGNAEDTDECTNVCEPAACGDGIVWVDNETCDDGNDIDSDDCPSSCESASCGDGFVQEGVEGCDDGNNDDDDGCSADCTSENRIVFVTSQMFTGDMGGLVGADASCQGLAEDAGLPGTYLAWLSTMAESPSTRFTQSAEPYVLVDGTVVADDWADLTDGGLTANIDLTETGGPIPIGNTSCAGGGFPTVWTNTSNMGTGGNQVCDGFTSTNGGGRWGQANDLTQWTQWCSGGVCTWESPIYCFQQ